MEKNPRDIEAFATNTLYKIFRLGRKKSKEFEKFMSLGLKFPKMCNYFRRRDGRVGGKVFLPTILGVFNLRSCEGNCI